MCFACSACVAYLAVMRASPDCWAGFTRLVVARASSGWLLLITGLGVLCASPGWMSRALSGWVPDCYVRVSRLTRYSNGLMP